ncbi:MAG: DUF6476 family protein [Pseudomonadota bacterium]
MADDRTDGDGAEALEEVVEDPRFRVMRLLVKALLMVMIAGVLVITIALLAKLNRAQITSVAGLAPEERLLAAEANAERVTLTVENAATGARRVIVLDGATFDPVREIVEPAPPQ